MTLSDMFLVAAVFSPTLLLLALFFEKYISTGRDLSSRGTPPTHSPASHPLGSAHQAIQPQTNAQHRASPSTAGAGAGHGDNSSSSSSSGCSSGGDCGGGGD